MNHDPAVPVTTIVVNWNGRGHLERCLSSLAEQSLRGCEIVVVDNASEDGSVQWIRERFGEQIAVVCHDTNRGYAAGLNTGIRFARGRYLFALNNDTEVAVGCLEALVEAADREPRVGACAPKILSYDDRTVIDNVGHLLYFDGLSRGRGRLEVDRGQYDRAEDILLFSGCAVLLRRAMLADIGLFNEDLFAYCDDTELGLRAQLAGWRCRFVPSAVVYHKYSGSSGHYSPLKAFLVERNRVWVAVRCLPLPLLAISPIFTALRLGAQAVGVLTRRGAAGRFASERSARELLIVLARAWLAALRGLPQALRQRRDTQQHSRIGTGDFLRRMIRHRMGVVEVALRD
jgi:GT2 family glycosyltransferase